MFKQLANYKFWQRSKFRMLLGFALLASASTAFANESTGWTKLQSVANWNGSERLFVKTVDGVVANPAGCPITDKYILADSSPNMSRSMIVAAQVSGLPVALTIFGGGCNADRPLIVSVAIGN